MLNGVKERLDCDYIAGCDGLRAIARNYVRLPYQAVDCRLARLGLSGASFSRCMGLCRTTLPDANKKMAQPVSCAIRGHGVEQ